MKPAGLILAGGKGRRMGGATPKPLVELQGRPLIAHVIERLDGSVEPLWIAAPPISGYERFELTIRPDMRPGFLGPLAGIEAGLTALEGSAHTDRLLVTPSDTPFIPRNIASLLDAAYSNRPVIARHGGHLQPAVGLWPVAALPDLRQMLDAGGRLAIRDLLASIGHETVDIPSEPDAPDQNPVFNVNTPTDLETAESHLAGKSRSDARNS
ncbi:molybdenum cofactor guanylyltransferase [Jiella marina]|uniref:molybdenum cofactor guanylyltransferase n=1 Tax=Jiella sp. LLJ827 TaxID=2917712 RepID=UPI00210184D1|nr:molybdenum cofactor guanylyltransferase [Jiella sp. LLJ827]MCQ0987924.1 molybdenum cofactor guanylyltransferase [Jiella sp. LLJ827]